MFDFGLIIFMFQSCLTLGIYYLLCAFCGTTSVYDPIVYAGMAEIAFLFMQEDES